MKSTQRRTKKNRCHAERSIRKAYNSVDVPEFRLISVVKRVTGKALLQRRAGRSGSKSRRIAHLGRYIAIIEIFAASSAFAVVIWQRLSDAIPALVILFMRRTRTDKDETRNGCENLAHKDNERQCEKCTAPVSGFDCINLSSFSLHTLQHLLCYETIDPCDRP